MEKLSANRGFQKVAGVSVLVISILAMLALSASPGYSACTLSSPTTWSLGASGDWNVNGDWSSGTYPNSTSTNVCIVDGVSTVTLNTSATVADLQLASGNSLNILTGEALAVAGTSVINAGQITLNGGAGSNGIIEIENNVTLSGSGTLTLSASGSGNAYIEQSGGSFTLTNEGSTIEGNGVIGNGGLTLSNTGTVNANASAGPLQLNGSGGVTNTGTLEATAGGTLDIQTDVTNTGGTISAGGSGSTVNVAATVTGGTLSTSSSGLLQTAGSAVLNGVTISSGSTYTNPAGATTGLMGTITNDGTLQLNGGGGTNGAINVDSNVTLQGGGTLNMSVASGGGTAYIEQSGGTFTLTNSSNTIEGEGLIGNGGLTLVNDATIDANVSGGTLLLNGSGDVTNTGTLEATSGGTLEINTTVNNAGGNITANGGTVQVESGDIEGGTLNAANSGTMETVNSATLDGSTASGAVTISTGSTYTASNGATTALLGTINNQGTIQLNGGGGTNGLINIDSDVTLEGGGTLNLSATSSGGGNAYIQQSGGNFTLTNANNAIQGEGVIGNGGLTLVNEASGVIDANSTGGPLDTTLTLNGSGGVTNQGLLEATNEGTLVINTTVDNLTGNITANGSSSTVQMDSATIDGGTLNTTNGGTMETAGSATLDGSTASGAVTISTGSTYTASDGATTALLGTINNQGTIQLNGGGGTNGVITVDSNVTLEGGGTLNMSVASGGGNAYIEQSGGTFTLTNSNNTIEGEGVIGNGGLTLVNDSTIDANASGGTLLLNGSGGVTNTGTLEATSGGTLEINTTVNNAAANITANGSSSTVQMDGATIDGGTLNTTSGGTMETVGSATLNGSTASGAVTISTGSTYTASDGATTALLGTINNQGTIQLNGGGGTNGLINIDSDVTLEGGGTLNMSVASGGGDAYIEQSGGNFTLTNSSNTIEGEGVIGNGGLTFVNGASGSVFASVPDATLLLNGSGSQTNNGTYEAVAGALLESEGGTFTNFSGTTLTGGTYDANGTIQIDQLGSAGGEIVTNDANIILDGSNSGAATVEDDAGKNALSALATNEGSFTVENGGNADFTTAENLTNTGSVTVGAGTTLTIGPAGGNNYEQETNASANTTVNGTLSSYIYSQSAGNTTINTGGVLNAIGAGFNQSSGTTTVNGTLNPGSTGASINGGTLYGTGTVNGSTTVASAGALQPGSALAPGTLNVTGGLTVNGTLNEVINSASAFNVTAVSGGLTLGSGSTLDILMGSSFTPSASTSLDILSAGSPVSGTFTTIDNQDFTYDSENWQWNVSYNPDGTDGVDLTLTELVTTPTTVTADWTTGTPATWTTASDWACGPGPSTCVPSNGTPANTVYDVNVDNTASGATMTLTTSETVNTLTLTAGTLDIASGASLNLADQPNGITDIPEGAGLSIGGHFTAGANNGLYQLTSIEGTLTVDNGGSGVGETATPTSGTLTVSSTGAVNIAGSGTEPVVNGNLANSGDVTISGGASLATTGNYSQTSGMTTVNDGSLGAGGALNNDSASTLYIQNGGSVTANSVDNFGNVTTGNAVSDSGNNSLSVTGTFTNESSGALALMANGDSASAGTFSNAGSVSLASGTSLTAGKGGFSNSGTVSLASGSTLTAASYAQSAGTTDVDGTLISPTVTITGGTLEGSGTIEGAAMGGSTAVTLSNATIEPGNSLTVYGSVDPNSTDPFVENIYSKSNYGVLNVVGAPGTADISGSTLDINLPDGYGFLTNGETFTILDATGGLTGTFATIDGLDFGSGDYFTYAYGTDTFTLTANIPTPKTPEPASLLLLGTGLLALGWMIRRKGRSSAERRMGPAHRREM